MVEIVDLPRIKVCGVAAYRDVELGLGAGLTAVGFVHHKSSPRHVPPLAARAVIARLPHSVLSTLVVVDGTRARVESLLARTGARAVQLCGAQEPSAWRRAPYIVLRRVAVVPGAEREIDAWRGVAAGFVLDHPAAPGGSGWRVDLDLARDLARLAPCLLAGGLDETNVEECIGYVRPYGVDASSRLESAPARKDPRRVQEFVRRAAVALAAVHGPIPMRGRS